MDEKALLGLIRSVKKTGIARFTRFLDPAESIEFERECKKNDVTPSLWGGYEDAERRIGAVSEDYLPERSEFSLVLLKSSFDSRFGSISHRDVLGAAMGLGLTRDCIGDIIFDESSVYLFASEQISTFVMEALSSAGRTKLHFVHMDSAARIPPPKGEYFRGTVSSLRLDAVVAEAYRMSRSESSAMIHAGHVKVNHVPCEKVDVQVEEGTMLSVAGHGRISLRSIDGMTKKQRLGVTFFRYT